MDNTMLYVSFLGVKLYKMYLVKKLVGYPLHPLPFMSLGYIVGIFQTYTTIFSKTCGINPSPRLCFKFAIAIFTLLLSLS